MTELEMFEAWADGSLLDSHTCDYHALDALRRFRQYKDRMLLKALHEREATEMNDERR